MSARAVEQLDEDTIQVEVGGRRVRAAARCPHRKGLMVHGYLGKGKPHLTCPLHYSTFDLVTGCALAGPADGPLAVEVLE
jgi:nitrite reductase (NADH) small subunit